MPYSLLYRRPTYVSSRSNTLSVSATSTSTTVKPTSHEAATHHLPHGVPDELSFERILSGKTCKPCTIRDFMNYLLYIELSAENLQFFLWFRDYLVRFSNLPPGQKALSPVWQDEKLDVHFGRSAPTLKTRPSTATTTVTTGSRPSTASGKDIEPLPYFQFTIDSKQPSRPPITHQQPSLTRPDSNATTNFASPLSSPCSRIPTTNSSHHQPPPANTWDKVFSSPPPLTRPSTSTKRDDFRTIAADTFAAHSLPTPFTIQPYREEISRIIATYIAKGSPRELNLSSNERTTLLHALSSTTHPSAFSRVANTVETSLRRQSHPNFVRFAICNGDAPRIAYATVMGALNLVLGILTGVLLTLSRAPRGYRAFSAFFLVLGFATLVMARRGICIVLNTFHQCHLQPWELFEDKDPVDDGGESGYEMCGDDDNNNNNNNNSGNGNENKRDAGTSFDSFGSGNSFEDAPWVGRYAKMPWLKKVFGRQRRINEPALRKLHDTMLLQSLVLAGVGAGVLEVVFLLVPKGGFY